MNKYFTIRNQVGYKSAEILIYGDIGDDLWFEGTGAKEFADNLKNLGYIENLQIRINSPGGSVFEGLAIYNTLFRHKARKTVTIDGLAASIASVIAMAGDTVIMPKNAIMMIHDPFGLVVGNSEEMRKMADGMDKIKEGLISAYTRKTRLSKEQISDLMSEETWMTADEAVEWGFADETDDPIRIAAHFDLSKFKNVPRNVLNLGRSGKMDEHEKFLERQQAERERVRIILDMGKTHNCLNEAVQAVENGTSVQDFGAWRMKEYEKNLRPLGPLDRSSARDITQPRLFRNFGEQLIAIYNSSLPGAKIDERLRSIQDAATGLGTDVPSEGGFLVQQDFSMALLNRVNEVAILAKKCWHVPIGANADGIEMSIVAQTSRATGSRWGGVQVYRRAEADTVNPSKPKFDSIEVRLEDLMGICYLSNRMLKDAPSVGAIMTRAFEEEMSFRRDDEIIRGTGAGQMLGLLNSPALVTVSKETNQAAKTIVYENLVKMWSRMPTRNRIRAEWYYNQEIEPQLYTLGLIIGMGGSPVYMPAGGISSSPYAGLFGRPLIPIEQASALGDKGDIFFADLNEYMVIEKGGLDAEQSIHVRFIYDESCFRFIVRDNGLPLWKKALTPYKGANDLSPFVTLEAR
jgi:HK97 family phage major capsid protein/ATP-dependent Clp endopeptidase proteolytic subunit ClpP